MTMLQYHQTICMQFKSYMMMSTEIDKLCAFV